LSLGLLQQKIQNEVRQPCLPLMLHSAVVFILSLTSINGTSLRLHPQCRSVPGSPDACFIQTCVYIVCRKQVEREKRQLAKEAGMIRSEITGAEVLDCRCSCHFNVKHAINSSSPLAFL